MSALDPQQLGEFEILEKLGHGGMGAVYKARQSSLGRLVALKVLPGNMANDEAFITRFKTEARSAASLNHPGIVQVYAAGEDGGVHYFAMEFVDGESLHGRLHRKGRIVPLEALAICTHVATALNHGWKRAQLIHRDIKPDNIFLSRDGEVKLGDLGLAKSLGAEGSHLTQTGTSMGTPYYVSPEQAHGDSAVDFRADIYSLGCTLFHLLCGQTPYTASTAMAVMIKHITQPPPDIFAFWPECPAALGPLLSRMLAKAPAERHQSYEELIHHMLDVHQEIRDARPGEKTTRKVPATDSLPAERRPPSTPEMPVAVTRKRWPDWLPWAFGGMASLAIIVLLLAPWKKPSTPALSPTAGQTASAPSSPAPSSPPFIAPRAGEADFVPLFNGRDLTDWDGDPKHWWVSNGTIMGAATPSNPVEANTALIWKGGPVSDFTLRLTFRITAGNSGVQYRSRMLEASHWVLGGYQAELYASNMQWNGALYEERGSRGIMADVGEQAKWKAIGVKEVLGKLDRRPPYRAGEWNDLEIAARGDRLVHLLNGVTAIDVTDEDPARQARTGLLGLRLLKSTDLAVQFKDLRLKKGTPANLPSLPSKVTYAPPPSTPLATSPTAAIPPPTARPNATPSPTPASSVASQGMAPTTLTSRLNPGGGVVYQGVSGPGLGKHIVFLAGEEEYRSEELLPQFAKIMAAEHGFKCTVLFSTNPQTGEIDPNETHAMPGLEALATADLCVTMLRFRAWPDAQMKMFADYYLTGKSLIALRTSTHAFSGLAPTSPYSSFNYNATNWPGGFGRQVFGETWTSHWGQHKAQATRAMPAESAATTEPILRGVTSFVGSTDVYEAAPPADVKVLLRGQVLSGMTDVGGAATGRKKRLNGQEQEINNPMMPIAWTREVRNWSGKINRVFTCTMGTAAEFQEMSFRRLLVNACYWGLGFGIPENNKAALVGEYRAHDYGMNGFVKGVKPADLLLPGSPTGPSSEVSNAPVATGRKITLFDGTDTAAWLREDGRPADWAVINGALEVGALSLATKEKFQDFQLHAEFWIPRYPPEVTGQARGNSGIYLQRRYELQILDSSGANPTTADCGAIFKQRAPDRNASTGPETWQSYDVTFHAARFDAANRKIANARVKVVQNGITIHNNVEITAATGMGSPEGGDPGSLLLQSNVGKGVRFRNVWIVPL